jgi:hypothetical protein
MTIISIKRPRPADAQAPPPPTKQRRASQQHDRQHALHDASSGGRPGPPRRPLPSSRPPTRDAPLAATYEEQCGTFFQLWFAKLHEDGLSEADMAEITSKAFRAHLYTAASGDGSDSSDDDDDDVARPSQPGSLQLTQRFRHSSPHRSVFFSRTRDFLFMLTDTNLDRSPVSRRSPKSDHSSDSNNDNDNDGDDDGDDDDDDDNDDDNDNTSPFIHIQIGPDPPPERPANLVQTLRRKLRGEHGEHSKTAPLHDDALRRLRAASRLQERPLPGAVSATDLHAVGVVLLGDVFGGRGQKRLVDALLELYGDEADRALGRSLQSLANDAAPPPASPPASGAVGRGRPGLTKLAAFASRLGRVVSYDAPPRTQAEDIRMLHAKVELVREWDRWSQPGQADRDVAAFLDGEGIARGKGVVLASRVIKYLAKTIDTQPNTLAKKIYAWRPLAILEEAFGPGVLALVSKSVGTSYTRLRNDASAATTKETKFRAVVAALVDELPLLLDVCRACDAHVVQAVLARPAQAAPRQALADLAVPGIKMAVEGEKRLLQRTPICDLLAVAAVPYPPQGTVQELVDSDSSDDGGEDGAGGDNEDE